MNDRDANRPGADPSKDLSDQILAQKFPPSGVQQGCGQQLLNYDHSNHSTLTPAAAPGIYQLGATFYPNVSSNQQQGYFQTNYGAPGAMPAQPGPHAHPWVAAPADAYAHLNAAASGVMDDQQFGVHQQQHHQPLLGPW